MNNGEHAAAVDYHAECTVYGFDRNTAVVKERAKRKRRHKTLKNDNNPFNEKHLFLLYSNDFPPKLFPVAGIAERG